MRDESESPLAGFVLDGDGTVIERLGAFTEYTGWTDPLETVVVADRVKLQGAIGRCLGTGTASTTSRVHTPDGATSAEVRLRALTDETGRPIRIYGTVSETTDDRRPSESGHAVADDD